MKCQMYVLKRKRRYSGLVNQPMTRTKLNDDFFVCGGKFVTVSEQDCGIVGMRCDMCGSLPSTAQREAIGDFEDVIEMAVSAMPEPSQVALGLAKKTEETK